MKKSDPLHDAALAIVNTKFPHLQRNFNRTVRRAGYAFLGIVSAIGAEYIAIETLKAKAEQEMLPPGGIKRIFADCAQQVPLRYNAPPPDETLSEIRACARMAVAPVDDYKRNLSITQYSLAFLLSAGLVGIGISSVRSIKRTVRKQLKEYHTTYEQLARLQSREEGSPYPPRNNEPPAGTSP